MKPVAWLRLVVVTVLAAGLLCPPQAGAQVPARFYWKSLSGGNGMPLIFESWEKLLPQRVPDDPGYPPMTTKKQFVPPKDMLAEPKP